MVQSEKGKEQALGHTSPFLSLIWAKQALERITLAESSYGEKK